MNGATPKLVWPANPQQAKGLFDKIAWEKGEDLLNKGRVQDVTPLPDGTGISGQIKGGDINSVVLTRDAQGLWNSSCTCIRGRNCKHAAAVLHRAIQLTPPPAKPAKKTATAAKARRETDESSGSPFMQEVIESSNRRLSAPERAYVATLERAFQRFGFKPTIDNWALRELGIQPSKLPFDIYGNLEYGPNGCFTPAELLAMLTTCIERHQQSLPEFLKPLAKATDLGEIMEAWRAAQEIRAWAGKLDGFNHESENQGGLAQQNPKTVEFRGRLTAENLQIEVRTPSKPTFSKARPDLLESMEREMQNGSIQVEAESFRFICTYLLCFNYRKSAVIPYSDKCAQRFIGLMLRQKETAGLIVSENGDPIEKLDDSLSWKVTEPSHPKGEYKLELFGRNGTHPEEPLCVIEGNPWIFVTANGFLPCPPVPLGLLKSTEPNLIPSSVMESRRGIKFLQTLRTDLPSTLKGRLKVAKVVVTIQAAIHHPGVYAKHDVCEFRITARAENQGEVMRSYWNGIWNHGRPRHPKISDGDDWSIEVFDRRDMDLIPGLVEPLGLKTDRFDDKLTLRVTRNFPEVFSAWARAVPPSIHLELDDELKSLLQDPIEAKLKLEVEETELDWFNLKVALESSDTELTPEETKALLDARGGFVRLQKKGWRRLKFDLSEEEDRQMATLGLNPRDFSSEPQKLHSLQLANEATRRFLPSDQVERITRRTAEIKTRVTPTMPAGVKATLRPYQLEGFHFLAYLSANRFGGILADDMGLGKTIQALTWLEWLRSEPSEPGNSRPSLVVCPKSVMDNWKAEATRFCPGLRVRQWSPADVQKILEEFESADLHIINYTHLRLVEQLLSSMTWSAAILDEGQNIKNPDSQTTQAARKIQANHRLILSGTPIENRLLDLWSLMSFAMPGVLGNRQQFLKSYDSKNDPLARQRLAARTRPFLLRRTKSQVAQDLPDRMEEDLMCEFEGEQRDLYQAELKLAQQRLLGVKSPQDLAKAKFNFLNSLLRLRQICCHPALVSPTSKSQGAKLEALQELLEPLIEEGHKVLIFSQFVEMLRLIEESFADRGWTTFKITGESENRGAIVDNFQNHNGPALFFISLKAGGFGLNLTAANYVVLFDPWWNPAVENQAIDRSHRIGQKSKVIAYRLLMKGTIEEKIRMLQKTKSSLAEDVLGEQKFSEALTLEDFQFLLQ